MLYPFHVILPGLVSEAKEDVELRADGLEQDLDQV